MTRFVVSDDVVGGHVLHQLGEHNDAPCLSCLMTLVGERFTPAWGTQWRTLSFMSDDVVGGTFYTCWGNTKARLLVRVS